MTELQTQHPESQKEETAHSVVSPLITKSFLKNGGARNIIDLEGNYLLLDDLFTHKEENNGSI